MRMVRGRKKQEASGSGEADPEAIERRRLKRLALSNNILSETPAKSSVHYNPSNTVLKHHGKDIIKTSQRKNRYLFSFPGLLAPISGGKIGELKNLSTKNPILYLDFPHGQMKLFGTIVYPKNRYLTLQFSKGGKNVMCEDVFDDMAKGLGYAINTPEELKFVSELAAATGVVLDPVYSGKAALGLLKDISENPKKWEGRKILFVHTGGLLGLCDKVDQLAPLVGKWNRMDVHESVSRQEGTGKMF